MSIINSDQSYNVLVDSAVWTQLSPPTVATGARAYLTTASRGLVLTNNGVDEIFVVKSATLGGCPTATPAGARASANLICSLLPNQGITLEAPVGSFPDSIAPGDYWALALVDDDALTVRMVQ